MQTFFYVKLNTPAPGLKHRLDSLRTEAKHIQVRTAIKMNHASL